MKPLKFILMFVFLSVMAVISIGCRADKRPTPQNNTSHKKPAGHFIGYSTPWDWARQNPTSFANALANNGLNYTIIEVDFKRDAAFIANWVRPFRDRGITVEIILVNWNTRNATLHSDSDFYKLVDELKAKVGSNGVIYMPITEPGNRNNSSRERAKAGAWMRYGYNNLPGAKTICIKESWWGQGFRNQAQYEEYHLCSESNDRTIKKGSNKISTNDCTPLIGASPATLYKQAKLYLKHKSSWSAYHANWAGPVQFDMERISAIGQAIQES